MPSPPPIVAGPFRKIAVAGHARDFAATLEALRARLDRALEAWIRTRASLLAGASKESAELAREVGRVVAGGGKRLRPVLLDLAYRACGGRSEAAPLRLGMAVELLHTYLLVHDDIMDHADLRRGRSTTHAAFAEAHRAHGRRGDAVDFGRAVAILAGDLAHTWAAELSRPHSEAEGDPGPVEGTFDAMCEEVIGGQYLEMLLPHRIDPTEEELLRVLRLKSGRYTVERPVELGALLAGAGAEVVAALERWSAAAGEAFQLQDDVLGTFGDLATTGKSVASDLAEGKRTFLVHHALAGAAPEDRDWLRSVLGRDDLTPADHERARRVVEASGALAAVRGMIDERLERATRALDEVPLPAEALAPFAGFLAYLEERER
jgi:geranylgeranyl diphosphate synthase type I